MQCNAMRCAEVEGWGLQWHPSEHAARAIILREQAREQLAMRAVCALPPLSTPMLASHARLP